MTERPHNPAKRWSPRPGGGAGRQQRASFGSRRKAGAPAPGGDDGAALLYGWHTVTAALTNPQRRFRRLLATENILRRLTQENIALPPGLAAELVRPDAIDARLGADAVHQGLLAEADPLDERDLQDIDLHAGAIVLVLDQITDPHNVGAILRSAAAFGIAAAVTTARHSPAATGVLAKAASGALEHLPIVTVGNLAQGMRELRQMGFLLLGLDSSGGQTLGAAAIRDPLALVLGAEGKGLRQLTRQTCDEVVRLDLPGAIKSLNVSNAAALAMYIAATRLTPGS